MLGEGVPPAPSNQSDFLLPIHRPSWPELYSHTLCFLLLDWHKNPDEKWSYGF
jgi:hypothetical protein